MGVRYSFLPIKVGLIDQLTTTSHHITHHLSILRKKKLSPMIHNDLHGLQNNCSSTTLFV